MAKFPDTKRTTRRDAMYRSRSALPTFAAAALTITASLIISGAAKAGPPDEKWEITLKGPDKVSLDPNDKSWKELEVFDAVSCEKLSAPSSIAKNGTVKLIVLAREGAGSATKGQLGSHIRWQVSGMAPNPKGAGPIKMYFSGDSKPTRKGAQPAIAISPLVGTEKRDNIGKSAGCDKPLPASPIGGKKK